MSLHYHLLCLNVDPHWINSWTGKIMKNHQTSHCNLKSWIRQLYNLSDFTIWNASSQLHWIFCRHSTECELSSPSSSEYICKKCASHTRGVHCELCEIGYYGDPNSAEGCKPCGCNRNGTHMFGDGEDAVPFCDPISGTCDCLKGASGQLCDQCGRGTFKSGIQCICKILLPDFILAW